MERLQTDASVKDDSSQKQPTLELFWEIYLLRTFQKLQEKHHDSVYFFVKLLCLITFIKTFLKLFSCEILKGCFYPLDVPRTKWRLIVILPVSKYFCNMCVILNRAETKIILSINFCQINLFSTFINMLFYYGIFGEPLVWDNEVLKFYRISSYYQVIM